MPSIGSLDRRITIQRSTSGARDGYGQPAITWADLATVWARRMDVSDGEKVTAGQRESARLSRFVVRSSTTTKAVTAKDRLSYDGATWNVLGIKETGDGRNRYLELTAVRESD